MLPVMLLEVEDGAPQTLGGRMSQLEAWWRVKDGHCYEEYAYMTRVGSNRPTRQPLVVRKTEKVRALLCNCSP